MPLLVQKFGGTIVADPDKLLAAASRAIRWGRAWWSWSRPRAMPPTGGSPPRGSSPSGPPAREMDMRLSTGEAVSIALMVIAARSTSSLATVNAILDHSAPAHPYGLAPAVTPPSKDHPYMRIAPRVAEMRDQQGMKFSEIGRSLGVSPHTASRAYDFTQRESRLAALERGDPLVRKRIQKPSQLDHLAIVARVRAGARVSDVAREFGCSKGTVYRFLGLDGNDRGS